MGENKDSKKRIRFLITLSVSVSLFLATVLLVVWSILLIDKTRSTHVRSDAEYGEIIKKNYIKGFEHTLENGEFTFRLREDEINDFLYDGVKSLNDKHIENIYYERGENGSHNFYVDLKKTFFKTRVVITATASENSTLTLNINSVKIGKVDAYKYLERKGYLTSEFITKFSTACHFPVTYTESSNSNLASIAFPSDSFFSMFPKAEFTSILWDEVKTTNCYSFDGKTLSMKVDFSKLRTETNLVKKNYETELPNLYEELKSELEAVDFSIMSPSESKIAYSISEDNFNQLLATNIANNTKEEVSSSLLSSKATFELVSTNATFKNDDKIDVAYLYSLNGYLVDIHQEIEFADFSSVYFGATLQINKSITFARQTYSVSDDQYLQYFNSKYTDVYENIDEHQGSFISFDDNTNSLRIDLEDMNNSHADSTLRNSWKSIILNASTKTIDFVVQKTI